ncbi:hypothetical protein [Luteimonas terrae]|uniref:Uncharacterized protein n=1 Tax=Luteimonas terrae TaxID=1530191 RepID=A0ABU1XUG8_9GAMM|nr:hypothetical protein [Luteimonas terrae]MDR7192409.1 hypothetical protein [Luteimonas terrae]
MRAQAERAPRQAPIRDACAPRQPRDAITVAPAASRSSPPNIARVDRNALPANPSRCDWHGFHDSVCFTGCASNPHPALDDTSHQEMDLVNVLNSIDPAWAIIAVVPLMALVFGLVYQHRKPRAKKLRFWVVLGILTLVVTQLVASALLGA